jgi:hypothetical protein
VATAKPIGWILHPRLRCGRLWRGCLRAGRLRLTRQVRKHQWLCATVPAARSLRDPVFCARLVHARCLQARAAHATNRQRPAGYGQHRRCHERAWCAATGGPPCSTTLLWHRRDREEVRQRKPSTLSLPVLHLTASECAGGGAGWRRADPTPTHCCGRQSLPAGETLESQRCSGDPCANRHTQTVWPRDASRPARSPYL